MVNCYTAIENEYVGGKKTFAKTLSSFKVPSEIGHLGSSVVKHLPLAQVVIPGSGDRVPHGAPHREPASPSACVSASLCLS